MINKRIKLILNILAYALIAGVLVFINKNASSSSMLRTVLQMGAVYALVAVSMNLLNGFTGLFSLGQAGFMAVGAYVFAVSTIPAADKPGVYYLYGVSDALKNVELPVIPSLIIAGLVAAFFAALIGMPVLRLKSDYFAIATLGFSEIVRIIVASTPFAKITNGSLGLKKIPGFPSFYFPFIVAAVCIALMLLLIHSSYGRAFKAIREDEIAAEAMGINLAKTKLLSFVISSFFAGIGGALLAMYLGAITSTTFPIKLTYDILLIVVIGGMGSVSGSVMSAFFVVACKEWWLRFLDQEHFIGSFKVPLLKNGFRMVVFSLVLMIVVLFFRRGIMGDKELSLDGLARKISKLFNKDKNKNGEVNPE